MIFVQQVDGSDNLVSFTQLGALFTVEGTLKILNLAKLVKSCVVLVGFQAKERDVTLHFASFGVNFAVIIFVDLLDNSERLECIICQVSFVLEFTQVHNDLS